MPRNETETPEFEEKVVFINRVAKVVKGGRRFSFSALVVVGNKNGKVGVGLGKAAEVPEAIRKGVDDAKKNLIEVALKDRSIPHGVIFRRVDEINFCKIGVMTMAVTKSVNCPAWRSQTRCLSRLHAAPATHARQLSCLRQTLHRRI